MGSGPVGSGAGTVRRGQVRYGTVWSGWFGRSGEELKQSNSGPVGMVWFGAVRFGKVRLGRVGLVRSGGTTAPPHFLFGAKYG